MNRMRLILLAAAILAAALAAYLSTGLMRQRPAPPVPPVVQKPATVDVLVAARNVTTGEQLGNLGLQWRPWPAESVAPEMITREEMPDGVETMQGARARAAFLVGEPIVDARIVRPGEAGFLSSILPNGMRAVAIPITELSSVSGFVLPNDRVDVIVSSSFVDVLGNKASKSEVAMSNVRVLAINQTLGSSVGEASIPDSRTAVLEIEPLQAAVISRVLASGQISLALRPLSDIGNGKPELADAFRNPNRATSGPLIIRYGLERQLKPGQ
ncbi:MAG: Flp pilus assembly protein CpaB [Pseudomonadota bacterium]